MLEVGILWVDYFLFLLKVMTFFIGMAFLIVLIARTSGSSRQSSGKGAIKVKHLNQEIEKTKEKMQAALLSKDALKKLEKEKKTVKKDEKDDASLRSRSFLISFTGDVQASQTQSLTQEVNAILSIANAGDEVIVVLDSPGGAVSGYGLAASQLQRLVDANLLLTVCVDKVAASGGYMMACVAHTIYAAPFAIVGSIGVVSQVPNVHRLLKRFDVDVDVMTAGKHKAPLTLLGENTEEGRIKHRDDLAAIHNRFKEWVTTARPALDIKAVSEGDFWLATDALPLKLIDGIKTSDDYLRSVSERQSIYAVQWHVKKTMEDRLKGATASILGVFADKANQSHLP